jgi:nitrite reductase/ring-hydroxylating ferredoxin subunit
MIGDFAHRILNRRGTFADCYPNMRTIVPQDKAAQNSEAFTAENRRRGAGKVTGHGPHYDSWHGHPLNTVNVWCAIGHVRDGNGMLVYPGVGGKLLPCDASRNIRGDQILGAPLNFELEPGDGVVFLANLLHSSELNRTDKTRCVISMRMTFGTPDFPGRHGYRYVYTDWAGTRLDRYARLRVQLSGGYLRNLAGRLLARLGGKSVAAFVVGQPKGFPSKDDTSGEAPAPVEATWNDIRDDSLQICSISAGALRPGEIRPLDGRFCVARTAKGYLLHSRFCPHEGADLSGGSIRDNGEIVCPWHNLTFDIHNGQSPCRSIARLSISAGTIEGDMVRFIVPVPCPV